MWSKVPNLRLLLAMGVALMLVAALACSSDDDAADTSSDDTGAAASSSSDDTSSSSEDTSSSSSSSSEDTSKSDDTKAAASDDKDDSADEAAADAGFDKASYKGNGGSFAWTGAAPTTFSEAPSLAALVKAGSLPAVEDRLPAAEDVFVVAPVAAIGEYGGTWRRAFTGPNDGQNADRIMMDEDIKFDLDGVTIIPNIAKSWEISDDGTVYTLTLRKGMKWSDGAAFNADNYIWWFENVLTNEEINPGRNKQLGWSGYNVDDIFKVDETHVQYIIPERADGFLDQLATYRIGGFTLHGRIGDGDYGPSHYMEQYHRDFASDKAAYDKMVADEGFESWPLFFKERSNPRLPSRFTSGSATRTTGALTQQASSFPTSTTFP